MFCILFTVIGMSMTLIGDLLGNGFHSECLRHFVSSWPRNFLIALFAEMLIIQPITRYAMVKLHRSQANKRPAYQV